MRVRVRYAKTGKVRFVSAIDMGRIWERALRRADLPIAYSEGYSPHPKVSFPDALPLGYASTGEYAELTFAGPFDLPPAVAALNDALPTGMDLLAARVVADGDPRLSRWLRASVWDLAVDGVDAAALQALADDLDGADEIVVERDRKGEITPTDIRPSLVSIASAGHLVRAVLTHVEPPTRPSELLLALTGAARRRLSDLPELALATRVAQGHPTDDGVTEALTGTFVPGRPPARQEATTP